MTDRELMQMALDALEHLQTDIEWQYKSPTRAMLRKVKKALRAALAADKPSADRLAQPEQEPVAWVCQSLFAGEKHDVDFDQDDIDALPVGAMLYTAPPQREWKGLTDEEIYLNTNYIDRGERGWAIAFARAIEAKLKEKNDS